ncbi:hypothetical protein [Shimia sagamensis]|uniref:Uncharacterized protein n=1 Tax=Shimia sagamensis TaxID=1566352 RepID=A0ABY1PCD0_9RHOB|nr:hypothetical protein [Shimia sagamensis]SMP31104.1 hypothetical protein SAMN06265373_107202 [Shimia sagamensis]
MRMLKKLALPLGIVFLAGSAQAKGSDCLDQLFNSGRDDVSDSAFFAALGDMVHTPQACSDILSKAHFEPEIPELARVETDLETCRAAKQTWIDVKDSSSAAVFEAFSNLYAACPIYAQLAKAKIQSAQAKN